MDADGASNFTTASFFVAGGGSGGPPGAAAFLQGYIHTLPLEDMHGGQGVGSGPRTSTAKPHITRAPKGPRGVCYM